MGRDLRRARPPAPASTDVRPARPTLQSLADELSVTKMTVSNAFSRPDQVSLALRQRILQLATERGYAGPDPAARALARRRTGTIGVLLTDQPAAAFDDPIALGLVAGIARGLAARSHSLVLLADQSAGEFLPARDVAMDGALVYACSDEGEGLQWLQRRRLPLVAIDEFDRTGIDVVNIDDRGGAFAAAQHLAELGHRRVGGILPWLDAPTGVTTAYPTGLAPRKHLERWNGWCDALRAQGAIPAVAGLPLELTRSDAERLAITLLDRSDRPTALVCFSDVIAVGVYDAAARLGLTIPTDLSVVGFDDHPLASTLTPQLTTVRQDLNRKGGAAVSLLFDALDRNRDNVTRSAQGVVIPTELIVRQSTGPPER